MSIMPCRRLAHLALIATSALVAPPLANARVTQITVTATESPTFEGRSFGAVAPTNGSARASPARSIPRIRSTP